MEWNGGNIFLSQDEKKVGDEKRDNYYPFGLEMKGRSFSDTTYRYGFNGKEKDGSLAANTEYDYGFRIYNPSIAKFLSVDPLTKKYPELTPYQFASNTPIQAIDLDGAEKLDFRLHLVIYGAAAFVTYPCDWLEDKIIGGGERMIHGAQQNAKNEYDHSQYQKSSSQQYIPEDVEQQRYEAKDVQSKLEMAHGLLDQMDGATAIQGLLMGGVEGTFEQAAQRNIVKSLSRVSVDTKLEKYLLNSEHPSGASKAKWFKEALGFTKENAGDLAKQIVFDPSKAVQTGVTEYGTKYNQVISIVGKKGKTIDVNFAWIKSKKDNVTRLVTAIPTKK